MSVKLAVKFAAFSSAAVVVLALVTSILIVRDINDLYDEVMGDMQEFKDYSNGAWDGMLVFTTAQTREARHIRRQAYAQGGGGGYAQAGGHASVGHVGGGMFRDLTFKFSLIFRWLQPRSGCCSQRRSFVLPRIRPQRRRWRTPSKQLPTWTS